MTKLKKTFSTSVFLSLILCSAIFLKSSLNAQDLSEREEEAQIQDDPRVQLTLDQLTQDPATGIITFILTIDSKIDADRARISWRLNGQSTLENLERTTGTLRLEDGGRTQLKINVIPIPFTPLPNQPVWRPNEFFALLEVNLIDGLIQATARKNFATSFEGVVLPITEEYEQAVAAFQTGETIKSIGFIFIIVIAVVFGFMFFKSWISIDEQEFFEKTGGKISLISKMKLAVSKLFNKKSADKSKASEYEY